MKATRHGNTGKYRSKNPANLGKLMFGYKLALTPEEQAEFKKQQGKYFVETEEGLVLWNRDEDHGNNPEIVKTREGKFSMILDEEQVAYEKSEKRPLWKETYFKQAQQRIAETLEQKIARKQGVASSAPIAVAVDGADLENED